MGLGRKSRLWREGLRLLRLSPNLPPLDRPRQDTLINVTIIITIITISTTITIITSILNPTLLVRGANASVHRIRSLLVLTTHLFLPYSIFSSTSISTRHGPAFPSHSVDTRRHRLARIGRSKPSRQSIAFLLPSLANMADYKDKG